MILRTHPRSRKFALAVLRRLTSVFGGAEHVASRLKTACVDPRRLRRGFPQIVLANCGEVFWSTQDRAHVRTCHGIEARLIHASRSVEQRLKRQV